jgi:hypothetical protein
MEEYLISPEQMLRRGLRAVGCGSEVQARCYKKTNVKNFKAHYGPHPNHCATIWKDILVTYSLHKDQLDKLRVIIFRLRKWAKYDCEAIKKDLERFPLKQQNIRSVGKDHRLKLSLRKT